MQTINYNKLSKDYKSNPTKEDVYYLYEVLNFTRRELIEILGLKSIRQVNKLIRKFNIHKSHNNILDTIKRKTSFNNPKVQEKCRNTIRRKYGGNTSTCSPIVKAKVSATNIRNFGVQSSQRHLSKETCSIINSKNNFTKFILKLPYVERTYHNIAKLLGMSNSQINKRTKSYNIDYLIHKNPKISQYERDIFNYIKNKYGIKFEFHNRDQIVNPISKRFMELDLFYRPLKLAIEFNSTRWHTDRNNKGRDYHDLKEKLCKEKDIKLLFLWQEWWNKNNIGYQAVEAIDKFIRGKNRR